MKPIVFLLSAVAIAWPATACGLSWREDVTAEWIQDNPNIISVEAVEEEEGMLAFTVSMTRKTPSLVAAQSGYQLKSTKLGGPGTSTTMRYILSRVEVKDGTRSLYKSRTPLFARGETSKFHFSIPREFLQASTYSLTVGYAIDRAGSEPSPTPGSVHYEIRLADFAPPAVATTESSDPSLR